MRRVAIALATFLAATLTGTVAVSAGRKPEIVSPGKGLCAAPNSVFMAEVSRESVISISGRRFSFPAQVRVKNSDRARALARAICGLPRYPPGIHACPADIGLVYLVQFLIPGPVVSIAVSGCETVAGAGPRRWAEFSPLFWRKFGRAIGLSHATRATFLGRESPLTASLTPAHRPSPR